jgi:hypothetical protein
MDIKKPDLSVILDKLSFLKNNLALLAPICLALVAGLLLIPTELVGRSLRKKIESKSIAPARQLDGLRTSAVSEDQPITEREFQRDYAIDANQIAEMSIKSSSRPLLSYMIFPEPKDTSTLIFEQFGQEFINGIDAMVENARAKECPTDAELESVAPGNTRAAGGMTEDMGMMDMYGGYGGGGGGMTGYGQQAGRVNEIEDAICKDKAVSGNVYFSYSDVAGYDFWNEYTFNGDTNWAIGDCWFWQLGYWIVEDVFSTVISCNKGSSTVFSSPVKRIKRVAFERDPMAIFGAGDYTGGAASSMSMMSSDSMMYEQSMGPRGSSGGSRRGGQSGQGSAQGMPIYVTKASEGLTASCTDRLSDDVIDVVHFNLSVIIQSDYVLDFMRQLCSAKEHRFSGIDGQGSEQIRKHNQISILDSNIVPVVRRDFTHNLYRYGEDAVCELNLICEYVFEKQGYQDVFPVVLDDESAGEGDVSQGY